LVRFVPTPDSIRVTSRKFDGLVASNFNLASTFVKWDTNFVELLRVQTVGAIIPWRDRNETSGSRRY
jgi:hypothetical protein